jgi:hypothetical protein
MRAFSPIVTVPLSDWISPSTFPSMIMSLENLMVPTMSIPWSKRFVLPAILPLLSQISGPVAIPELFTFCGLIGTGGSRRDVI